MKRITVLICGAMLLICLFIPSGFGQSGFQPGATWTAGDGNWSTATNWDCQATQGGGTTHCVPGAGFGVVTSNTVTLDISANVDSIFGNNFTTNAGTTLTTTNSSIGLNLDGVLDMDLGGTINSAAVSANNLEMTKAQITVGSFGVQTTDADITSSTINGLLGVNGSLDPTNKGSLRLINSQVTALDVGGIFVITNSKVTGGQGSTLFALQGAASTITGSTLNGASLNIEIGSTLTISNSTLFGSNGFLTNAGITTINNGTTFSNVVEWDVNGRSLTLDGKGTSATLSLQASNPSINVFGGTATVSGGASILDGGNADGTLQIGTGTSAGQLNITSGGSVSLPFVNIFHGGITVTGMGSTLNADSGLTISADGGGASLTVDQGAAASANGGLTLASGSLTVDNVSVFSSGQKNGNSQLFSTLVGAQDLNGNKGNAFATVDHGSTWNVNNSLAVGEGGNGTVTIQGGGQLNVGGSSIFLGVGNGSSGILTLDGAGSKINLGSAGISVGQGGAGVLNVQNGGSLDLSSSGANLSIANGVGSSGMVTVNGAGSGTAFLTVSGVTVGNGGKGLLEIEAGGQVTIQGKDAGSLLIGNSSTGSGTLNIDGAKSTLVYTGDNFNVGVLGQGIVNVTGGARLGVDAVTIGSTQGGIGALSIGGSGSTMVYDTLQGIAGQLNVSGGGQLISGTGTGGDVLGGQMVATVDGAGASNGIQSTWLAKSGLELNDSASVTVSGGGQLIEVGNLNLNDSSVMTAKDANSSIQVQGNATIGTSAGNGTAILNVINDATFSTTGNLNVGLLGAGTLNIAGGVVDESSSALTANTLFVGGNSEGSGTVTISNGGQLLLGSASLNVGKGTVQVSDSGMLKTPNITIAGSNSNAILTVSGTGQLGGVKSINVFDQGVLQLSGGAAASVSSSVGLGGAAILDVRNGSLTIGSGPVAPATTGFVFVDQGGLLSGVNVSGITPTGPASILGNVMVNGGRLSPGDPETFKISGNYIQTAGFLDLQIEGTGAGQFDKLLIGGAANFTGGQIEFDFANGFAPTKGETFDLLDADGGVTISGVDFLVAGLGPGFEYSFAEGADGSFDMTALNNGIFTGGPGFENPPVGGTGPGGPPTGTPEPSVLCLLVLGTIGLALLAGFGGARNS
jgi:T5SS/PEP-CTERM-associated repeat protein